MSKLKQALNYLQILREAIRLPLANPTLTLSITLLILLPLRIVQYLAVAVPVFFDLGLPPPPFPFLLQWLANTFTTLTLSKAYIEKPSSTVKLLKTCHTRLLCKVFATSFLGEIITFGSSSLLVLFGHPFEGAKFGEAGAELARFAGVMAGFCGFMWLYLACELGVMAASVEEGCFGMGAIGRGAGIVGGRKVECFVLVGLMFLVDWFVGGGVGVIGMRLVWCSVCCMLYLESRKREQGDDEKCMV